MTYMFLFFRLSFPAFLKWLSCDASQMKGSSGASPFGIGFGGLDGPLFGAAAGEPPASSSSGIHGATPIARQDEDRDDDDEDDASEAGSESGESDLVTAMAGATLDTSPWAGAPAHPALYLSTTAEYIPPPPKAKLPAGVRVEDSDADGGGKGSGGGGGEWGLESYENSMELDHVFERFTKRVGYAAEQCVR
jgi:pre-rRNA-processing protein TSR4